MAALPAVPDVLPDWIPAGLRADLIKNLRFMGAIAAGNGPTETRSEATREQARAQFERLHRLCTDARMEFVYQKLMSRKRKDYKPTNEAQFKGQHHKFNSQEQAVGAFIINGSAATSAPFTSKARVAKQRQGLERAQKALAKAAADAYDPAVNHELERYATRCNELIAAPNVVVLGKITSDAQSSAYIVLLTQHARLYFGTALHGIVATVANVALNRKDVTIARVRKLAP